MTKRSQKCVQLSSQPTASKHRQRALNVRSTRRNKKQPRRRPLKTRTRRRQQSSVVRTKEHGTSHRLGGTDDAIAKVINENFEVYRVYLVDSKLVTEAPSNLLDAVNKKIYIFLSKSKKYVCQNSLNDNKIELYLGDSPIRRVSLTVDDFNETKTI